MTNSYLYRTIKGLVTHPSIEFQAIAKQRPGLYTIIKRVIVPLSIIFVGATFLKAGIKYFDSGSPGPILSVIVSSVLFSGISLLLLILQILLGTLLVYSLAKPFKIIQSFVASLTVIVFSFVLYFLSTILAIIPVIGIYLTIPALIYCFILLYWGIRYILDPPKKQLDGYYFSILIGLLVINILIELFKNLGI